MKKIIPIAIALVIILSAACREDVTVFEEENKFGTIYVDSTPTGAEILLNFQPLYRATPDSIPNLEEGNYFVTLRLQGFQDTTVSVEVQPGGHPFVNIKL